MRAVNARSLCLLSGTLTVLSIKKKKKNDSIFRTRRERVVVYRNVEAHYSS